jgi:uncharacterized lipoprotein YmbA
MARFLSVVAVLWMAACASEAPPVVVDTAALGAAAPVMTRERMSGDV